MDDNEKKKAERMIDEFVFQTRGHLDEKKGINEELVTFLWTLGSNAFKDFYKNVANVKPKKIYSPEKADLSKFSEMIRNDIINEEIVSPEMLGVVMEMGTQINNLCVAVIKHQEENNGDGEDEIFSNKTD